MRRKIITACLIFSMLSSLHVNAADVITPVTDPAQEPTIIRCTFYVDKGIMRNGSYTHQGAVAGRKEWLGKVACINSVNEDGSIGDFLGYYEFCDTGAGIDTDNDGIGDTLPEGNSIDIWLESEEELAKYQMDYGDYVYLYIVDGEG